MQEYIDKKAVTVKCVVFIISLTNITLTALFFIENLFLSFTLLLFCGMLFVVLTLSKKINSALYRLLLLLNFIILFCIILYKIFGFWGISKQISSVDAIKKWILSARKWGIVVYFLITVLQVVILPIPAAVTIVLGSLVYGEIVAFFISSIGTIAGSFVCYGIGKFFGFKVVSWVVGTEKTENAMKLLGEKGKIPFIAMILFPFFPDDILCMTAGLVKISFKFFAIVISICRPLVIAFISFFGTGSIIPFSGWGIPVWIAIFSIVIFIAYLIANALKK